MLKTKYKEINAKRRDTPSPCSLPSTSNQLTSCLGHKHFRLSTDARGVATLPAVLLLGAMALVVAVSVTALSFTELFISQGSEQSSRAQFYAESGVRDALIKIARNKSYTCPTTDCYTIDFSANGCALGNDCAKVQVIDVDSTHKNITSDGIMKASMRTLQAVVTLDANGAITNTAWSEVTN